jgi:hypothetical protein
MNTTRAVRSVARRVRRYMEAVAEENGWDSIGLEGFCGRASAILHRELRRAGLPSQIVAVEGHTFVRSGDYVVDITATQFREYLADTAIRRKDKVPRFMWWWSSKPYVVCNSAEDWIDRQIQDGWTTNVVASHEDFELVKGY